MIGCKQCTNAHRILKSNGAVARTFAWNEYGDDHHPAKILHAEGAFVNGKADPARELASDDLQALIEQ